MAGTITHEWNGTVLTITSDAGTSSADLQGAAGDIGPRGPQGPAGVVVGGEGSGGTTADLTDYYTKSEVDALIPDVSGYATDDDVAEAVSGLATETFVTTKIAEAELSGGNGGSVDLSGYATKDEIPTKTSQLTNDSGFLTEHQSLDAYALKTEIPDTSGFATTTYVDEKVAAAGGGSGDGTSADLSNYRTLDNNVFTDVVTISNDDGTIEIYPNGIQSGDELWIGNDGEGYFTNLLIGTTNNYKEVATKEYVDAAIAALDGDGVSY